MAQIYSLVAVIILYLLVTKNTFPKSNAADGWLEVQDLSHFSVLGASRRAAILSHAAHVQYKVTKGEQGKKNKTARIELESLILL